MPQDYMTTKLSEGAAGDTAGTARPRRRLGAWQGSTGELPAAEHDPVATAPIATATFPLANRLRRATRQSSTLNESLVTAPLASDGGVTDSLPAPVAPATVMDDPGHSASTVRLPYQSAPLTRPFDRRPAVDAAAATMALPATPSIEPASVGSGQATAPMRSATAPIAARSAEDADPVLQELRARAAASPDDSDTLFELSVALHRAGARREAREELTKLVALYEQRGQHQQASRIKGMLGAPKTGPITTEDLPPRPVQARTTPLDSRSEAAAKRAETTRMTGSLRGRTAALQGQTVALRDATAAIGRAKEQARLAPNLHAFPPEAMLFTVPLPGQEKLQAEVLALVEQSEKELEARRYLAAFDTCVQVIALAPDFTPIFLRLAEIYTRQRHTRRARAQADALIRLADAAGDRLDLWMVYRVLLHASGGDTVSLRRLVELLLEAGQTEQASIYASRLIQILDAEGLKEDALDYSMRLCELVPGDTRAALENAILRLKAGDRGGALDRWESAVAAGANPVVAKASVAALTVATNEDDHWRMLSEVIPDLRQRHDDVIVDAYVRTAAVMPESTTLIAGRGLVMLANGDVAARDFLAQAAGARNGAPLSRAAASVALAWGHVQDGRIDEYVAAVRTAIKLLQRDEIAAHPAWEGLLGRIPRFEDLSLELGDALLQRGDAAGAAEVLKEAHDRVRHHAPICERLAEAYFKTGQLGSALTVLDELAVHYRSSGQLESMAAVLRQMSQLAPNNIKVKSRLIDAYLQRGFVAEARAELIQRADLEERSGLIKDAVGSLQRAADLSWTIGLAEETFAVYARVIALAPDDVGNRSALVNFYLQMGRLSEAAEHQRAVVAIALRNNHRHEAIAALHQVIGLTPDDTSAYYQLAELLSSMGEYHQAEKVYRRLLLMNPTDAIAQAKATAMAALNEN